MTPLFFAAMSALGLQTAAHFKELMTLRIRTSELAEGFRAQKDLAERANAAKTQFLAAASHDLRQPVHAIGLYVGVLRAMTLPEEVSGLIRQIETSLAAMGNLFEAILDVSALDAGVVKVRKSIFAIQPVIDRVYTDFAPDAKAKGVSILRHPSSAVVFSDPVLIERILRNLISNAVRYTSCGRVVIGCRRRGGTLGVQVWDTGIGVPAADQERIFEEYFQSNNPEDDRRKGLGLGLAIVRRLADLLECALIFRSELGRGSCFGVSIPRGPESAAPSKASRSPEGARGGRDLVAVFGDHARIPEAMATLLAEWGYSAVARDRPTK